MIRALACSFAASMVLAACGGAQAPKPLPTDLPPPEYEKPRGYDMAPSPSSAPAATTAAPNAAAPPASNAPKR